MYYLHTRVAVRCALRFGDAMMGHVDPHSKKNEPALWPFGGVVNCADTPEGGKQIAYLKQELGAERFEGELGRRDDNPRDLSFWLPSDSKQAFKKWLDDNQSKLPIAAAAAREIAEEFKDFRLPERLAQSVRYGGEFKCFPVEGPIHTYLGKASPDALCYTYVVQCTVPAAEGEELRRLIQEHEDLYLITHRDVPRKDNEKKYIEGTVNGKRTKILVPAVLGLLFK